MSYDLKKLTIEEKIALVVGANKWQTNSLNGKLDSVFLSDGPNGLRKVNTETNETACATAMPNIFNVANTWNTELAFLDGETIADECLEQGADVLLAPGVNIKRTVFCGRNFEYFSEDPYLAGTMAKAYINGAQSKGVGTSLKHYAVNNSEHDRRNVSSEVDERTLREIYLKAFEIALEAKPYTVMGAYNLINGIWSSENKKLLIDILRNEFGFDGLVVSDWGASHNAWRSIKNGTDLLMPFSKTYINEITEGYEKGYITEEEIDKSVIKVLELIDKIKNKTQKAKLSKEERHLNALEIAKESMVLLKNENVLPLNYDSVYCVIGEYNPIGGSGSAGVKTDLKLREVQTYLQQKLPNTKVTHNYSAGTNLDWREWSNSFRNVSRKAYENDAVIVFVSSTNEGEGYDRESVKLSNRQEDLILTAAKNNENVIVVVTAGSYIDMSNWIDKVKAVLYAGFAGEAADEAIASILAGETSPSGKLSETFPYSVEDTPSKYEKGNAFYNKYSEGILVGYRWYDTKKIPVLFPFGHGLSYANFEYSNLNIEKVSETDYNVFVTVKNTSQIKAKEVVELYVKDVFSNVERPLKELKAFTKVELEAGESKTVKLTLDKRSFAYYSIMLNSWHIENGVFEILVGSSSQDIRLKGKINIELDETTQYTLW